MHRVPVVVVAAAVGLGIADVQLLAAARAEQRAVVVQGEVVVPLHEPERAQVDQRRRGWAVVVPIDDDVLTLAGGVLGETLGVVRVLDPQVGRLVRLRRARLVDSAVVDGEATGDGGGQGRAHPGRPPADRVDLVGSIVAFEPRDRDGVVGAGLQERRGLLGDRVVVVAVRRGVVEDRVVVVGPRVVVVDRAGVVASLHAAVVQGLERVVVAARRRGQQRAQRREAHPALVHRPGHGQRSCCSWTRWSVKSNHAAGLPLWKPRSQKSVWACRSRTHSPKSPPGVSQVRGWPVASSTS